MTCDTCNQNEYFEGRILNELQPEQQQDNLKEVMDVFSSIKYFVIFIRILIQYPIQSLSGNIFTRFIGSHVKLFWHNASESLNKNSYKISFVGMLHLQLTSFHYFGTQTALLSTATTEQLFSLSQTKLQNLFFKPLLDRSYSTTEKYLNFDHEK